MPVWLRWVFGALLVILVVGVPFAHYRASYAHAKRLRVVSEGKVYRCGQLTADGFQDAIRRYGIRTVLNLQQEAKDPFLPESWQKTPSLLESDLCAALGVNYVQLDGGVLDRPQDNSTTRPEVIDEFLELMDDPKNLPVLIHCRAGLHRTGLMVAVYRMEYEGWTKAEATRELRANGFGTFMATEGNPYLVDFISNYEPGFRRGRPMSAEGRR
jgi:tyrosine-protein phosphatase SIW14